MGTANEDITAFLQALGAGNEEALGGLFAAVYNQLRGLARSQRRGWRSHETLATTALVHEAYLKLLRQDAPRWRDRGHFFAVSARAMRHILINHAKHRQTAKRGGGVVHVPEQEVLLRDDTRTEELLALDQALTRLERTSPRQARVVECRFFAGLGIEETAEALEISPATVKREWSVARARLHRELGEARDSQ